MAQEYGKSTRQLSVRAKSTKDNPGTLPISAYGRRTLKANPSSNLVEIRNNIDMQEPSSSESEDDDVSHRIEDNTEDPDSCLPEFISKKDPPFWFHTTREQQVYFCLERYHRIGDRSNPVMQQKCTYTPQIQKTVCSSTMSSLA